MKAKIDINKGYREDFFSQVWMLLATRRTWPIGISGSGPSRLRMTRRVAGAIRRRGLKDEGINLLLSDSLAVEQEVFQAQLQVLPRTEVGHSLLFSPQIRRFNFRFDLTSVTGVAGYDRIGALQVPNFFQVVVDR